MIFQKKTPRNRQTTTQLRYQIYDQYAVSFLERLTTTIREESLFLQTLSLTWTAGPATYIALQIAYQIGYGRGPSQEIFYYLAIFTLITGLLSISVTIAQRATAQAQQRRAEKTLLEVVAKIPDLVLATRNQGFSRLNTDERRVQAALLLLRDPDALEGTIQTAIEDLTGDESLGRHFQRIESYRRKGLFTLIQNEAALIRQKYPTQLQKLHDTAPHAAALLESRLAGHAPSKRIGQRRTPNFLQHILEAIQDSEPEHIQYADVETFLKLLLEFLIDRRFSILRWKLSGEHPIVSISKQLENLKVRHRKLQRKRRLIKYKVLLKLDEANMEQASPNTADTESTDIPVWYLAPLPDFTRPDDLASYKHPDSTLIVRKIVELRSANRDLETLRSKMETARQELEIVSRRSETLNLSLGPKRKQGVRVRFEQEQIVLSHKNKVELAERLNSYFSALNISRDRTRILTDIDDEEEDSRPLTLDELRALTVRFFAILEEYVDLSEEAVIDGLEGSHTVNLSSLDYGLSKRIKVGWLQALVEELEIQPGPIVLKTAKRIVQYFHKPLSPGFTAELSERYGIAADKFVGLDLGE